MKLLRTAGFLVLSAFLCTMGQRAMADVYASFVRVTQETSTAPFDGRFNDGSLAAIRFILSDHADSVLVRIKSGADVIRTIKAVNYSAGDTSVIWNGKTDAGADVASGTYGIQIATYDKGYNAYTEIYYDGPDNAIFTRGVTTATNPDLRSFGFIYTASGGGYAVGVARHSADGRPWGNAKGVPLLTTTGAAVGGSASGFLNYSSTFHQEGYIYLIRRNNREVYRYHTDTLNVALVDSGGYTTTLEGLAIRGTGVGKYIALAGNAKIYGFLLGSNTSYSGTKDVLVDGDSTIIFWDVVFGRDSSLYATFYGATDNIRPGIAKFDFTGYNGTPLKMSDTVWTATVDSGRGNTATYSFGSDPTGANDVLYFTIARRRSGDVNVPQGIYAVTNLNGPQPTTQLAYADKQNNLTQFRSDIAVDAVGNVVYFENSNEEVVLISPPTGANNYTYDSPTTIRVVTDAISIAAARIDANGDFVPDRLNDTVRVIGIVNGVNLTASANRFSYSIQDEEAGIVITKASQTGGGSVYQVGDRVVARGIVTQFNGTAQLDIFGNLSDEVVLLDKGNPVTPIPLTIAQRLADPEKYESRLIKISYLGKASGTWPATSANATLTMTNGFESLAMFIDLDTDIDQTPEPVYPVNVVGIATQFTTATPPNTGYQISPRFRTDFTENVAAPPNPHFALLAPANGSTVMIDHGTQTVTFQWQSAVDLNGDALIYQWAPVGFTAVATGNAAKDTFLVRTGNQLVTYLGTKDTVDLRWTALAKDPANPAVANVDTFTVKLIRGAIVSVPGADLLPQVYGLEQNYPNPFNPSTTIRFALPTASYVTLRIYNILGQEVVTLVDDIRDAGYVNAVWDGRNRYGQPVSSGMYVYRIEAKSIFGNDGFVSNKKMLLLK